ncbi:MAG: S9 family peptidase [Balneolales bacterium]
MLNKFPLFLLCYLAFPLLLVAQELDSLQLETIFHEPYLAGVRPEFVTFSPDEKRVYFNWNDSSKTQRKQYSVNLSGADLKEYKGEVFTQSQLSPDGKMLAFSEDRDLWISDTDASNKREIFSSQSDDVNPVWSPDSKKLAFVREGDVWIANVDETGMRQLTRKSDKESNYRIRYWTGDGKYLILTQYDSSNYWDVYFPEYVDKFVTDGKSRRGQAEITVTVLDVDSLKTRELLNGVVYLNELSINKTGNLLAIDCLDKYMKEREITVYDLENKTSKTVFEDSTEGWIYPQRSRMEFAPNSDKLYITSERDGWSHIYTVNPFEGGLKQHTSGDFEVPWAAWQDDETVIFASTEVDPGERHIYSLVLESGEITRLTNDESYRYNFSLSPNKRYLVYSKTFWNQPYDLNILDLSLPRRGERQLTHSVPDRFNTINWQTPEYIRFTSRDGETPISMNVLKPADFDPNKEYPVVVFAHGAGSLQNVFKGFSNNYYREYMFNQILNQQGYVVVDVDFRHSTGYGRNFREDVTNWMGHYETQDIEDGLDYLNENGGYVDLENVGIYGGSYGGFMALYAVSASPDRFHAAAALRTVTNWENYYYANPWYTGARLGHPNKDSEHYDRSSPLTYADSLNRPVLLLHGLTDDNVGFQDAMQYIDRLIKSGNRDIELMVYPSERHAFQNSNAWLDEYQRIYNFFEEHLKKKEEKEAYMEPVEDISN